MFKSILSVAFLFLMTVTCFAQKIKESTFEVKLVYPATPTFSDLQGAEDYHLQVVDPSGVPIQFGPDDGHFEANYTNYLKDMNFVSADTRGSTIFVQVNEIQESLTELMVSQDQENVVGRAGTSFVYKIPYIVKYRILIHNADGKKIVDTNLVNDGRVMYPNDFTEKTYGSPSTLEAAFANEKKQKTYIKFFGHQYTLDFTLRTLKVQLNEWLPVHKSVCTIMFYKFKKLGKYNESIASTETHIKTLAELQQKEVLVGLSLKEEYTRDSCYRNAMNTYRLLLNDLTFINSLDFESGKLLRKYICSNLVYLDILRGKYAGPLEVINCARFQFYNVNSDAINRLDKPFRDVLYTMKGQLLYDFYARLHGYENFLLKRTFQ